MNLKNIREKNRGLIERIRIKPVKFGNYSAEFDVSSRAVQKRHTPIFLGKRKRRELLHISRCFYEFMTSVSDGLNINIGNHVRVKKFSELKDTITPALITENVFWFGENGGDEAYVFDLRMRMTDNEPSIYMKFFGDENYSLLNTRFDRFLSIQYYLLKSTEFGPTMSYEQAIKHSQDKQAMAADKASEEDLIQQLYEIFDPKVLARNWKYGAPVQSLTRLRLSVKKQFNLAIH